jgi:hypothetical protein
MQINRQTYEEYFILYADGELNESEKKAVEQFIEHNPDLAGEFGLIQDTIMKPDGSIIFENKELLFRDESEERKVLYMRWYRMAAAAVLLLAFSVIGWLFLGDGNMRKEPVAVVQPPQANKPTVTDAVKTEPTKEANDNTDADEIATRSADKVNSTHGAVKKEKEKIKQDDNVTAIKENNRNDIPEIINEPEMAKIEPTENFPEAATITHDVVTSEPVKEIIDVQVEPRAMDNSVTQTKDVEYAQSFRQESDNDMIYFANTSLTKKTKLRGVLRKATRYLDRVTSLQ